MQVNRPEQRDGIGPYRQQDQEKHNSPEKQLPNPKDFANNSESHSMQKEATVLNEYGQTDAKTNDYATTFLNFASSALRYGANSIGNQLVTKGLQLLEVVFFSPEEIRTVREQNLRELKTLTGDANLGLFLEQLSIPISSFITSSIEGKHLKVGVENEVQFLQAVTKCMTVKMAVNVGRQLKSEGKEVSLLSIGTRIATLLKKQIGSIQQQLKEAEAIEDPAIKEEVIKRATAEAVEVFLKLAFPKGEEELPLRDALKGYAWSYLKDTLLPDTIREMAALGNGIELLSKNSTAVPKNLAEVLHETEALVIQTGPKLLADKEVADALTKVVFSQIGLPKNKQTGSFAQWVSGQIQMFGDVSNTSISDLWKFLGFTTGSAAFFFLANLAKNENLKQDWKENVINNVLSTIYAFENVHQSEIERVRQQLLLKGIKPEKIKTTQEYIQCFIPLSKMIEEIGGIEELKTILSSKAYGSLESTLEKGLAINLALAYEDYLQPLAIVYQSWQNPEAVGQVELLKSLPGGMQDFQQIEGTADIAAGLLSQYLSKNSTKVGDKVCDKVFDNLPNMEDVKSLLKEESEAPISANETTKTPLIEKQSTLNAWLHIQVEDLLLKAGDNSQADRPIFWKIFTSSIAGILEHIVIYKKAQSLDGKIENIPEMVVNQFTACLDDFQKKYDADIQKRYNALKAADLKPQENEEFVKCFIPLCEDLLAKFGVKQEGGGILESTINKLVLKFLPAQFAEYYQESLVIKESTEKAELKLEKVLKAENFDKIAIIVNQTENVCHLLSEKLSDVVSEFVYDAIIEQIVEEKKKTSQKDVATLTKEVKGLIRHDLIKSQNPLIQKQIYSLVMQSLSNYLEKLSQDGIPVDSIPPEKILHEIGKTFKTHLKTDAEAIKKASLIKDPEQRKLALRAAFTPLTNAVVELVAPAGKDGFKIPFEVPFADLIEENWQEAQSQIIPDLLGKMYTSSTTWTADIEKSKETLRKETNADYAAEACRIMAGWTYEFIPASIMREEKDLTEAIYNAAVKYLDQTGNKEGLSVKEFIQKNEVEIKKRLAEDCYSFFAPDGELISTTKPVTTKFIEGAFLKIFSNLTTKINDIQGRTPEQQEAFMVNLGINLLGAANKHFGALTASMKSQNKSTAFDVSHETFIKDFQAKGVLNPGIPQNMEIHNRVKQLSIALEKERRIMMKHRDPAKREKCLERIMNLKKALKAAKDIQSKERQQFFAPFAKSYMELSGITSPEQIPCALPPDSPLRQELFDKFQDELLPMVIETLFERVMDPRSRVKMALAGLKTLNQALDQMPTLDEEQLEKDDLAQRELNRVSGELVLQIVQLVPKSMIKAAFKIERVQELSAEMVGKSVRKYLGTDLDIMKLINQGIKEGMDSLHPGEWVEGENGQVTFVAKNESGELNFKIPLSAMEEELKIQDEMKIADQEIKELRKSMVGTTRRVMSESFSSFLVAPLIKLKQIWDYCVDFVFRKYGPAVRDVFDRTGFKFLYRFMEVVSFIVSYPAKEIFWFFMEIHIGRKADEVIKSMELDIHENLFYQLADTFTASLEQKTPLIPREDILQAAEQRDKEERLEVLEILKRFGLMMEDVRKTFEKTQPAIHKE